MITRLPFGIRFIAESTAMLIGGLSSAAASGAATINAGKMNKRGAKTAKQMQQIGNEFAANEAEKARAYQTELYEKDWQNRYNQWKEENEYNSASAQRKRYEEAGLNPFMAMQGQSAGMAQGMSSGTGTGTAQAHSAGTNAPNQVDPGPSIVSIGQSVSKALNDYYANSYTGVRTAREQVGLGYDSQRFESEISKNLAESKNSIAQALYAATKTEGQALMNKFIPVQQQADFYVKMADIAERVARKDLSIEQARTELVKQAKYQAEIAGQKISNRVAERIADSSIEAINAENKYTSAYTRSIHSQLPLDMQLYRQQRKFALEEIAFKRDVELNNEYSKWIRKFVDPTTTQASRIVGMIADALNPFNGFMRKNPFKKGVKKERNSYPSYDSYGWPNW